MPTRVLPPRVDLATLAAAEDPYAHYATLRRRSAICRLGPGQWLVTRYADVAALLRDDRLLQFQFAAVAEHLPPHVAARLAPDSPAVDFTRRIVAGQDGADHGAMRRALAAALRPALANLDRVVGDVLEGLLRRTCDGRPFDAVADLARPLALEVISSVVGVPVTHRRTVGRCVDAMGNIFSPTITTAERAAADEAVQQLRALVGQLAEQRRADPAGDVLTAFVRDPAVEEWPAADVVDNLVFLLFAGLDTSTNLIGNGCAALLASPDEQERLRDDRRLVPTAIEEFLRYDSPVQLTGRYTAEPIEIAGQHLRAGRVVFLLLGSANRDETQFERADVLDVGRQPNRHVAFGGGPHSCLGAAVARREADAAFRGLLERPARLEAAGPARRAHNGPLRTLRGLPVRFRR